MERYPVGCPSLFLAVMFFVAAFIAARRKRRYWLGRRALVVLALILAALWLCFTLLATLGVMSPEAANTAFYALAFPALFGIPVVVLMIGNFIDIIQARRAATENETGRLAA